MTGALPAPRLVAQSCLLGSLGLEILRLAQPLSTPIVGKAVATRIRAGSTRRRIAETARGPPERGWARQTSYGTRPLALAGYAPRFLNKRQVVTEMGQAAHAFVSCLVSGVLSQNPLVIGTTVAQPSTPPPGSWVIRGQIRKKTEERGKTNFNTMHTSQETTNQRPAASGVGTTEMQSG